MLLHPAPVVVPHEHISFHLLPLLAPAPQSPSATSALHAPGYRVGVSSQAAGRLQAQWGASPLPPQHCGRFCTSSPDKPAGLMSNFLSCKRTGAHSQAVPSHTRRDLYSPTRSIRGFLAPNPHSSGKS
ncbi:hypothetical protein CSUI_008008 [Cystoisospora suis]|uniref:Uncharacterized protein n=1 Tax=Cystoisospora suis TaxID=483139 RepID=A0A2C6KNS1_9APIC|nr:hypothetical protein CSUI_008008 [Cystoisospora suis]